MNRNEVCKHCKGTGNCLRQALKMEKSKDVKNVRVKVWLQKLSTQEWEECKFNKCVINVEEEENLQQLIALDVVEESQKIKKRIYL